MWILNFQMNDLANTIESPFERTRSRVVGTGEMADLTRSFDWSRTALGPVELWPDTLLVAVNIILATRHPMLLMWGPELIHFYNDAFRPSIGADKHPAALGQRGAECWAEIWPVIGPQIAAVMKKGEANWFENQYLPIHRDGHFRDAYWTYSYSPVRDVDGSICATLVACVETTKAVQTERKLQSVLEATTDSVMSVDRDWRITYLNKRAMEGLAPVGDDLLGANIWEAFPSMVYEGSPYEKHYRQAMAHGVSADFEAYYPEPLNFWVHVIVRPSPDGIIFFFRDITQKKREAEALMQSEKLAVVGRLASSIAHEINNPLESVTNLLYLLESTTDPEERKQYLMQAQSELGRVAKITTQTLRFHRQSTRAQMIRMQDVLENILILVRGRITGIGIEVVKEFRTERLVSAYEADLRQVFLNLISNALDASVNGGRLVLRVEDAVDWRSGERGVRVMVADDGHGMDKATQKKIFEPFFTTRKVTGTGLGLWISQGILQNHGAKVCVRSSKDERWHGTVFAIFFPVGESGGASVPDERRI